MNTSRWDVFVGTLPLMVALILAATLSTTAVSNRLNDMNARLLAIESEMKELRERIASIEAHPAVSAPEFGRR